MSNPETIGPPWWCATCESWRHTMPCGRDECPRPEEWTTYNAQLRRSVARQAGRLAEVVVNCRALTLAQKDEVVTVLRACEKVLLS